MPRSVVVSLIAVTMLAEPSWRASRAQAPADAASSSAPRGCRLNNPVIRGLGGATIGGWLGFVTAKIRLSDWNDDSRSGAAVRTRNRMTITGAAVGALVGVLIPHGSCRATGSLPADVPRASRLPIMAEEIRRNGLNGSVYDVVYSLRRTWLNVRGVETLSEGPRVRGGTDGDPESFEPGEPNLIVYQDNMRLGAVSRLHDLPTAGVIAIRYYDPVQANLRWGAGHTHGAIQVVTVPEGGGS